MQKIFTCYVVGEHSLLIKCSEILLRNGHKIYGVVSLNPVIRNWAETKKIKKLELDDGLINHLNSKSYDYLFSISNLSMLPDDIINSPRKCAINFHDGPLPKYAGTNVTSWAIMNREKVHGITWHEISREVDEGDILIQERFAIDENETSLSLNAKCFAFGLSAFGKLVDRLADSVHRPIKQNLKERTYFRKYKRPDQAAIINWNRSAEDISALVRALDFGRYANPLGMPKIKIGDEYFILRKLSVSDIPSNKSPGEITAISEQCIRLSTETKEVKLEKVLTIDGAPLSIGELIEKYSLEMGFKFNELDLESAKKINKINASISKKENYWVKQLSILESVDLHYVKKNIALKETSNYIKERINLGKEVLGFFKKLNSKPQISLASAFGIFVGRHCGKNDFNIGHSYDELMEYIGKHGNLFSEYVPLRVTFNSETSFTNAIDGLSGTFKKTADNKTYTRDLLGRYPELFKNIVKGEQSISAINIVFSENYEEFEAQRGSIITLVVSNDIKYCRFIYNSSAIAANDIKRFKAQFITFLEKATVNYNQKVRRICIISDDERHKIFKEWNNTKVDFPAKKCIHHLFEEQAAKTPEATAVVYREKSLTYCELNRLSNQFAYRLQKLGVEPETLVGIHLHRSLDMVTAVMGTLKAGGAYVPLDPSFPRDRISYMIKHSKCSVIITERGLKDELGSVNPNVIEMDTEWKDLSKEESSNLDCNVTAENLSYVIYTSGSTGNPKGVMIEHHNVVNLFSGMDACIEPKRGSTWLAVTSLSFDISVIEIFWTLARGFRVVIYPGSDRYEREHDTFSIPQMIKLHNVTHFQCTPSMASMLMLDMESKVAFGHLKKFLIGGEAFPVALAEQLQKVVTGDIVNMYGPTETTVWSTTYKINHDRRSIPIGRPIANTEIYIVDEYLKPVPIGVPGELMIGGAGVARGYFNQPEMTAERFISNPFSKDPECRLYRTGDLSRYRPDGNIEFLGRMDYQVKIRGYRIELGEIEAVLNDYPAVHEAVVIAREEVSSPKRLVAYVVPRNGERLSTGELRNYAKEKLPDYMVPAHVVKLNEFPQTPNKKIDRKALPSPGKHRPERGDNFEPPQTEIEEAVAEIWAEAIGVHEVGRNENFFELGGDSLSACGIVLSIQRTCNVDLPLQIIFHTPTVADLAKKLQEAFLRQADSEKTFMAPAEASRHMQATSIEARMVLSQKEGQTDSEDRFESPRTATEKMLATIMAKTLRVDRVSRYDHFFNMGGKSIDAVSLFAKIEEAFGKKLPLSILLQAPTLEKLANVIDENAWKTNWSPLVPIQPTGSRLPFFCVHAHRGNVLNYYPFAKHLGPDQPFYGIQARGLDGNEIAFRSFTDMAADYISEIRTVQPGGPYILGGWCMGGYIALEMAHLLKDSGEEVALLALIDTPHPSYPDYLSRTTIFHRMIYKLIEKLDYELGVILALNTGAKIPYLRRKIKALIPPIQVMAERLIKVPMGKLHLSMPHTQAYKLRRLFAMHDKAFKEYNPNPYQGRVVLFLASKQPLGIHPDPTLGWGKLFNTELELREIPGNYICILVEPSIRLLADELKDCLNRIDENLVYCAHPPAGNNGISE